MQERRTETPEEQSSLRITVITIRDFHWLAVSFDGKEMSFLAEGHGLQLGQLLREERPGEFHGCYRRRGGKQAVQ